MHPSVWGNPLLIFQLFSSKPNKSIYLHSPFSLFKFIYCVTKITYLRRRGNWIAAKIGKMQNKLRMKEYVIMHKHDFLITKILQLNKKSIKFHEICRNLSSESSSVCQNLFIQKSSLSQRIYRKKIELSQCQHRFSRIFPVFQRKFVNCQYHIGIDFMAECNFGFICLISDFVESFWEHGSIVWFQSNSQICFLQK